MKKEEMMLMLNKHRQKIIICAMIIIAGYITAKIATFNVLYKAVEQRSYQMTIGENGEKGRASYDCLNNLIKKELRNMSLSKRISIIYAYFTDGISPQELMGEGAMMNAIGCFALSIDWGAL